MCNDNNAASVKINASWPESRHPLDCIFILASTRDDIHAARNKTLATCSDIVIIIVTHEDGSKPLANAGREAPSTSRKRNTEPQATQRARRAVLGRSVLRPTGPGTGPIRNAPSGSEGSDADQRRRCHFWLLSPSLLQSPGRFRPGRVGRPHSATARPQGASQTDSGNSGVRRPDPCNRACNPNAGHRSANSGEFRNSGAPPITGAGSCAAEKKTACAIVATPRRQRARSLSITKRCGGMYWRGMKPRVCVADWVL